MKDWRVSPGPVRAGAAACRPATTSRARPRQPVIRPGAPLTQASVSEVQRLAGNTACVSMLEHRDGAEPERLRVQRYGEGGEAGGEPAPDTAEIISAAESVLGGKATTRFGFFAADPEWQSSFVMFEDPAVQRAFHLLLARWLGDGRAMEDAPGINVPPPWVGEFRSRALNVRRPREGAAAPEGGQPADEEVRLADLAVNLADSVAAETPAQTIRRQFVEEITSRIGTEVMSQGAIDRIRAQAASSGKPPDFTTCVDFFIQVAAKVTKQAKLEGPLLEAPLMYEEINPNAKAEHGRKARRLGDAWVPYVPGEEGPRPRPGDMPVFDFAEATTSSRGVKHGVGEFSHIAILRSIEPVAPGEAATGRPGAGGSAAPTECAKTERWIVVEGGSKTAAETSCAFHPETGLIERPGKPLGMIKGWIDVERAAAAAMAKEH